MKAILSTILIPWILLLSPVSSYKILLIPPHWKSHIFSFSAIAEGLAERGHNVSFFVGEGFPLNEATLKNRMKINVVRYNDSIDGVPMDFDGVNDNITRLYMEKQATMFALAPMLKKIVGQLCNIWTMNNDELLESMEKEQFDLAVVEGNFVLKCIYLIPHRLHVPWITYIDYLNPLIARVPWLPSFVPHEFLPYSDTMPFFQRLANSATVFAFSIVVPLAAFNPPPEVIDKYQQYGSFSSVNELASRSMLWLVTKDSIMDYPRPMMPNIIDVGGLTVKPATGKLPRDINEFVEGAENGVVLMTFGSLVSSFPVAIAERFLSVFRRLDGYRVIWRMKNTDDLIIPDNMMISQWLPQNEILAHPSVKLFITHCGNNGQFEAVYHGVPMIGFSVGGDQAYHAKRIDHKGYGLSMDLHDFTADQLLDNIYKILRDRSYKERIMKASEVFRSQAQSPVERAVFWIEHVCRFGGDHLHSAGNDLPLYSYLMLDVLAFILVTLHALVFLLFILARLVLRKCCRQRKLKFN